MDNPANFNWYKKYTGTKFHTNSIVDEIMNGLISDLDLAIQQSNKRSGITVPTWHVFYKGIRILAVDINKNSLLCRFLKMQYAPPVLLNLKGLRKEKWNKTGAHNISLQDISDAKRVTAVLPKHLEILDDAISGKNPKLEKPKFDKERLKEQYFEDEVATNIGKIQQGLTLVRRQLVIRSGRIDLLCKDDRNNPVVLELKADAGSTDVFEQISRYIKEIENDTGLETSGVIVLQKANPELNKLCTGSNIRTHAWKQDE